MFEPILSRRRFLSLCAATIATTPAYGQSGGQDMINDRIAHLAALSGETYTAERQAFLAEEAPLPPYPYALDEADPRFRVQYLILQAWQTDTRPYQEIEERFAGADVDFMMRSALGFSVLAGEIRNTSRDEWQRAGLPFAWEMQLKDYPTRPDWQLSCGMSAIQGFPHSDTIDPMLIMRQIPELEQYHKNAALSRLREMPIPDLQARLTLNQPYYATVRSDLHEALRGR